MTRRRSGNLVKGFAWLCLAAAALPSFATMEEPSGEATRLSVGLPWSPWLIYRESWSRPDAASTIPTLHYETAIEPQSGSTAAMLVGIALLLVSRFLKGSGFGVQSSGGFRVQGSGFRTSPLNSEP